MHSARPKDPCSEHCPVLIREALDLIAAKWTVPIFFALESAGRPLRYAELERRLEPITPKELAKHLRLLETAGLVERRVHPTVPPSVDYSLTEFGLTLHPSFAGLADWTARYGATVAANRRRADHPAPLKLIKPVYRAAG